MVNFRLGFIFSPFVHRFQKIIVNFIFFELFIAHLLQKQNMNRINLFTLNVMSADFQISKLICYTSTHMKSVKKVKNHWVFNSKTHNKNNNQDDNSMM